MTGALNLRITATIARHELRSALRSRWILAYAVIFAVLTLAISYFGLSVIEFTGFQGFQRTTASLLNLVLYIVPLVSMLMAAQSFSVDGGATDQLFTEPVLRSEILLGKLAGLVCANVIATLFGFGLTGLLIAHQVGTAGLAGYLVLLACAVLTGMVFSALAVLLAVHLGRGSRTYAAALIAWFLLVLIFDLLIIGLSFILPERIANRVAFAGVFVNPVDSARIATLLAISGKEMFGIAGAQLLRSLGGATNAIALLVGAMLAWTALLTSGALWKLNRLDL